MGRHTPGQCSGRKDPTAPHDLTLPGARTPDGKCRACKLFANRKAHKRARGTSVPLEKALQAAEDGAEEHERERGVPAYPRSNAGAYRAGYGPMIPSGAVEDREARAVFSELFDPDEWPEDPEGHCEPEDWSDLPPVKRVEEGWGERSTHRQALARLSSDPTASYYNRRLAWLALTTRGDA